MVALNFASDAEANTFYKIATTTISNRIKRRQGKKVEFDEFDQKFNEKCGKKNIAERRSRKFSPQNSTNQENDDDSSVMLRNAPATSK